MKKKGIGKRILSALLAFSLTVSVMPAGQLVSYAETTTSVNATAANVGVVEDYAKALSTANTYDSYDSSTALSWDYVNAADNWTHYNGAMLDAYMRLDAESYFNFVKNFYSNGNINADGSPNNYTAGSLSSIPMGLALLDIMNGNVKKVDLSGYESLQGSATYNEVTGNLEIFDSADDGLWTQSLTFIPLDEAIPDGKVVTITINGYWYGTTGFKVYLGNGYYNSTDTTKNYNYLPTGAFSESYTVVTGSTTANSGITSNIITIKGIDNTESTRYIDGLVIESITIAINESESKKTKTDEEIAALQATPFDVADDMYDQSNMETFNLTEINGATIETVYTPTSRENDDTFANGVVITEYKGTLYCQWQRSKINEDSKDTYVGYSVYSEETDSWGVPQSLPSVYEDTDGDGVIEDSEKTERKGYCSSGGWFVNKNNTPNNTNDDILVAYLNYWPFEYNNTVPRGGMTYYTTMNADGSWTEPQPVKMADGSNLNGIIEQDPHILDSGRIVCSAHFQENNEAGKGGLLICPIYSNSGDGVTGWKKGTHTDGTAFKSSMDLLTESTNGVMTEKSTTEIEPSLFVNEDGDLVMIFRTQTATNGKYTVLASVSIDNGLTWSTPVAISDLPDVSQKQSAGNLPDGTAYIINCPVNESNYFITKTNSDNTTSIEEKKYRFPLVISLSADGKTFDKAYVIGRTSKLEEIKFKAITDYDTNGNPIYETGSTSKKRLGYHYPKSVVIGNYLYVSYAENKETVEYVKIPLSEISLNSSTVSSSKENINKGLLSFVDGTNNSSWEFDYYLSPGDKIFVDRPKTQTNLVDNKDKFFETRTDVESVIPTDLVGSLYIRTAAEDKNKSVGDTTATILANEDIYLYVGLQKDIALPSWLSNNTEVKFSKVDGFSYRANDDLYYDFYKATLGEGKTFSFGGVSGLKNSTNEKGYSWSYFAMAVPVSGYPADTITTPEPTEEEFSTYKKTIQHIYTQLENQGLYANSGMFHNETTEDNYVNLEEVYMTTQFLSECANAIEDGTLTLTSSKKGIILDSTTDDATMNELFYTPIITRLLWVKNNMCDSTTGLYYHGYNTANSQTVGKLWNRGIGSYAMALVSALEVIPATNSYREELINTLKTLFDNMLLHQDATTGLWKNLVNEATSDSNMLETSGSAMMSYALMRAYLSKWVTDTKYGQAGLDAFNGIVDYFLENGTSTYAARSTSALSLSNISADVADYSSYDSVTQSNDAKGIAPLIMASTLAVDVVNEEPTDIVYDLYDEDTGISAVGANTLDASNTTEANADVVGETLKDGYAVYDIALDVYSEDSIVYVPIPDGVDAESVVAYKVENGILTAISGDVDAIDRVYSFNITEGGTYVFGARNPIENTDFTLSGLTWVTTKADLYERVQKMDSANTNGYVITNYQSSGDLYSLGWKDSTTHDVIPVSVMEAGNNQYMIMGVNINNLWLLDANSKISDLSSTYYLQADYSGSARDIKISTKDYASIWDFPENDLFHTSDSSADANNPDRYLKHRGPQAEGEIDLFQTNTGKNYLAIWYKTGETTDIQVALGGENSYRTFKDNKLENVVSDIKENSVLYYRLNENDTEIRTISFDDGNVDINTSSVNMSAAGTYNVPITYAGVEIGTVSVTVDALDWKDVTEYYYERVIKMEPGREYIITENVTRENNNSTIDSTVNPQSPYEVIALNNPNDNWGSTSKIGVSYIGNHITDNSTSVKKYVLTNLSDNDKWYINNEGNIYSKGNYENYIINENVSKDNAVRLFPTTSKWYKSVKWVVTPIEGTETVNIKGTVGDTSKYLQYNSNYANFRTVDTSDTTTILTLYSKALVTTTEYAMDGEKTYTVLKDSSMVSPAYIKANTKIYKREVTPEGVETITEIDVNDPSLTWAWSTTDGTLKDGSLNTNATGKYTVTVSYDGETLGSIDVNVVTISSHSISGNETVNTVLGQEPDLSNVKLTLNYSNGSSETITVKNGLKIDGYDINESGAQTATISYPYIADEYSMTINVGNDPYDGLVDVGKDEHPQYPAEGATRIKKDATNPEFDWYDTGITKVELDVAGITSSNGVDVVLITDLSNSMGRYYKKQATDDDGNLLYNEDGTPIYERALDDNGNPAFESDGVTPKYVDDTTRPGQKLDEAMSAATELAEILLMNNTSNGTNNNSISFVTFGGYDKDNAVIEIPNRIDVTTTVFVNEQDVDRAKLSFSNTKFITYGYRNADGTRYQDSDDDAWIQIYDNYGNPTESNTEYRDGVGTVRAGGTNSGGTNYDYAFAEATKAVKQLHAQYGDYEATGRKTVVLFMTDGAPTIYNYESLGSSDNSKFYGTELTYSLKSNVYISYLPNTNETEEIEYNKDRANNWYKYVSNANVYASELSKLVDDMYSVGFKVKEDFTSKHCITWGVDGFKSVLSGVAGTDESGNSIVNDVVLADDGTALLDAYVDIASNLSYSGTFGKVIDTIKEDFTLVMDEYVKDLNGEPVLDTNKNYIPPNIQVCTYDLITKKEAEKVPSLAGRIGERENLIEILETVSFRYVDGVLKAYSDAEDYTTDNILNNTDTEITITGKYFKYVQNKSTGVETFEWTIGNISEIEYALSYYAYLKGTREGGDEFKQDTEAYEAGKAWRPDGIYQTNQVATLEYVDINNRHATKTFGIPEQPWGEALTTVEFYLVNEAGEPVNRIGEVIPFENRISVYPSSTNTTPTTIGVNWNTTATVSGSSYALPDGHYLHNSAANYTVDVKTKGLGTLTIDDWKGSTKWVNDDAGNVVATQVAFGVINSTRLEVKDVDKLGEDLVVIDYGKTFPINVFENNPKVNAEGVLYTGKVVGFAEYSTNTDFINYVQGDDGDTTYEGTYGEFSLVEGKQADGIVQYKPFAMVSSVEKVFTVVEFTSVSNTKDVYYLYQPLFVIPATVMYYETDFTDLEVFKFEQSDGTDKDTSFTDWNDIQDPNDYNAKDDNIIQDYGPIGKNLTYGYDSTYENDLYYSDGSSVYVEGEGSTNTIASFNFTGTGFDLISRTGELQGMIRVQVYEAENLDNPIKTVSVLNKSESEWELYQIPVVSIDMNTVKTSADSEEVYGYGEYHVKISVLDEFIFYGEKLSDHAMNRGNQFCFDAVRIYNPIDTSDAELIDYDTIDDLDYSAFTALENEDLALCAYAADGEAYPDITEVRNILIKSEDMNISDEQIQGIIYVDRHLDKNPDDVSITTYETIGPNNEVYLSKGQAIAFMITDVGGTVASIDIGAKAVEGATANLKARIANKAINWTQSATINELVNSSTVQYFDLMSDCTSSVLTDMITDGVTYVIVENASDGILSITDIKVGYNPNIVNGEAQSLAFVSNNSVFEYAKANMLAVPDYDASEAGFTSVKSKVFGNATLEVITSKDVNALKITDRFGRSVETEVSYVDVDENRVWTVTILMTKIGNQKYIVTGYGLDGTSGESITAEVEVTTKEGGGWQNAKSIYKTLFNCRILSIKRNSGNKLFK